MYKCDDCDKSFKNSHELGGHVVSCHSDNKEFKCSYCEKELSRKSSLVTHEKYCKLNPNNLKKCEVCNSPLENSSRSYCSHSCANRNRTHSEETKKKIAKSVSNYRQVNDVYLDSELSDSEKEKLNGRVIKECGNCGDKFTTKISQDSKYCCKNCFYKSYSIDQDNEPYIHYRKECEFDHNVYNFSEWYDTELIEKHGWYKASNRGDNLNGISRDHIISVKYGWDHGINSFVISHPANCKLKKHRANQRKYIKNFIDLKELHQLILCFETLYNYS